MKKIFGPMIAIFLLTSLVMAATSGVAITTDKKLYQIGENITFTLYNNNSTTFEIDFKPSIVNNTGNCVYGCFWIAVYNPLIVPPGGNYSLTWDQKGENGQVSPGIYKGRLGNYYSNEFEISNVSSTGDILSYYRGLGQNPNMIETTDLLKAADDWRNGIIPPGFSVSLTTTQLLTLVDEWRNVPSV